LTEVVPAPYTEKWVTDITMALLKEIGQSPVLLKKEIDGFAVNRIQYALMAEYWRLVAVSDATTYLDYYRMTDIVLVRVEICFLGEERKSPF